VLEPDQAQFRTGSKIIGACSYNTCEPSPVFQIVHSNSATKIASGTKKYSKYAKKYWMTYRRRNVSFSWYEHQHRPMPLQEYILSIAKTLRYSRLF
jgi:hypothetical protein